jgi:small conductance mechanosensitive channel
MSMPNIELALDWANRPFVGVLLGILLGVVILFVGRWVARLITRYATHSMERAQMDNMVVRFLRTLIYAGLMAAVIIAALEAAGVHTTSLTALLAAAGVAIGLALKDTLANFASGLMILLFKPYTIDHAVEAAGTGGAVEEVSVFHTVLRTPDNVKVIVPNSAMMGGSIKNFSAYERRRVDLVVGIGYDQNIGVVRDILMNIMKSHALILADPAPTVEVLDLADNKVNLAVRSWVRTADYWQARCDVLEQVKDRFGEAGIEVPYPKQEFRLYQDVRDTARSAPSSAMR